MRNSLVGLSFVAMLICSPFGSRAVGAELERFVKKDGTSITGVLIGCTNGLYVIQSGQERVEIEPRDIQTTIPLGSTAAPNAQGESEMSGLFDHQTVLKELALRDANTISPDSQRAFANCLKATLRGEWDYALRAVERLLEREPDWAAPQILGGQLLAERGVDEAALVCAVRLEQVFTDDILALRVAGDIYRRCGFPERAALIAEQLSDAAHEPGRRIYERVRIWWPVDRIKAQDYWAQYRQLDAQLESSFCQEGKLLQRIRVALKSADWRDAQLGVAELLANFPWLDAEARAARVQILEARLTHVPRVGESLVAFLAADSLAALDAERSDHWHARRDEQLGTLLRNGLALDEPQALGRWSTVHGHFFREREADRAALARRCRELALRRFVAGELEPSRELFRHAAAWHPTAMPAQLDAIYGECLARVREDIELRRDARVPSQIAVLRDGIPELRDRLLGDLEQAYRKARAELASADELAKCLTELRAQFRGAPGEAPTAPESNPAAQVASSSPNPERAAEAVAAVDAELASLAHPVLARYYPHAVGTRWTYRMPNGEREIHEVVSLTPLADHAWRVGVSKSTASGQELGSFNVFLVGSELLTSAKTAPPGEIALKYPLAGGARWQWRDDTISYVRDVTAPRQKLVLPIGGFDDYIVVTGTNTLCTGEQESAYHVTRAVTYVAGIGPAKIECTNAEMNRVLVEFVSPE
ncbi:MAG: hypothetical protein ACKVX7_17045 [Planctomycetota bacterium]